MKKSLEQGLAGVLANVEVLELIKDLIAKHNTLVAELEAEKADITGVDFTVHNVEVD